MRFSDAELLDLGIQRTVSGSRGHKDGNSYIYRCATCGRPTQRDVIILSRPVYCSICKEHALEKRKIAKAQAEIDKIELDSIDTADACKKVRFRKAAEKMSRYGDYEAAIDKAKLSYDKYDSVPEALAAIALLHCGYRVIAQQPISDYTVDFVLPDEKVVIEIDGSLYHADAVKKEIRDVSIKYNLGSDWEILHIPAEALTKRPKAFEALIKKRIKSKQDYLH